MKDMQRSIDEYMAFFRSRFHTARISPKQHISEVHCADFMQNTGFWLDLLGEQGGEEAHALINSIKRRAWGLRSETNRLMLIMHEHMALVSPVLQSQVKLTPPQKKKKKRRKHGRANYDL